MDQQYVFDSFFPYLESIQICRGVSGWLRLKDSIHRGTSFVSPRLYSRTYFNLYAIFPRLNDPSDGPGALREKLSRQLCHRVPGIAGSNDQESVSQLVNSLSASEWRELASSRKIDRQAAAKFVEGAHIELVKLTAAIKPGVSLLEDLLLEAMTTFKVKQAARVLELWETAKMCHEGIPPYQVRLTEIVMRTLQRLDSGYHLPEGSHGNFPRLSKARVKWALHCLESGARHLPRMFTPSTCLALQSVILEKQKVS